MLAVAAVLAQGWWQRSRAVDEARPAPAPAEAPPRQRLRVNLEKAPLSYFSDYWSQLARQAGAYLVPVGPDGVTGILVEPNLAVASLEAAAFYTSGRAPAEDDAAAGAAEPDVPASAPAGAPHRLLGAEIESGLALFEVNDVAVTGGFTLGDVTAMASGAYVAAVSRGLADAPDVAPGSFVGVRPGGVGDDKALALNLALTLAPAEVAAIVDLDANLIGVMSGSSAMVVSAESIPDMIDRLRRGGPCRAIRVADVSESVQSALGIEHGVIVERVQARAFRATPRLQPGDVLTEWDDRPIDAAERFRDVYAAEEPGRSVRYRLLRGRRRLTGTLAVPGVNCRPVSGGPIHLVSLGMTVERASTPATESDNAPAWRIVNVDEGGTAAAAGIEPGDVVTAIDGAALDDDAFDTLATRLERRARPVVITLRRRDRVTLVAIPPP